eukprot:15038885-Ditylum_brightwellii.AAC.1
MTNGDNPSTTSHSTSSAMTIDTRFSSVKSSLVANSQAVSEIKPSRPNTEQLIYHLQPCSTTQATLVGTSFPPPLSPRLLGSPPTPSDSPSLSSK